MGGLQILRDLSGLRAQVAAWRRAGLGIGLVPTMGALHAGHLALIAAARAATDRVIGTLFVNPIQFNDAKDLAAYPQREAEDLALFADAGTDLLYMPAPEAVYPPGFATQVAVGGSLGDCLCTATRPGHMEGVATVVAKLFQRVQPDQAFFGEKDYQQLAIITRMARDLDIPVEVIGVPTVREPDGLALSSRNFNLAPNARAQAPALYRVLKDLAEKLADGREAAPLLAEGRRALLDAGFAKVDYLDLRRGDDLAALECAEAPSRLFAAAFMGKVRLIDNVAVL